MFIIQYDNGESYEDYSQWIENVYFTSYEEAENKLLNDGYQTHIDYKNAKWYDKEEGSNCTYAEIIELKKYEGWLEDRGEWEKLSLERGIT